MSGERRPPRIVCFSAYTTNLRAAAFRRFLHQCGYDVVEPRSFGPPGSILELALTLLPNCWVALTCRADLAAGFKPHPNVGLPLLICKLRGIPTWIDVDDLDHAYREGWMSWLVAVLQRHIPRWCTVITYHNRRLEEFLVHQMHCPPDRLVRVQQGVDYAFFSGAHQPADLPGTAGRRIAVYAAHLNVASDLEPVLQAWSVVVERIADALLLVVGGGPMLGHYRTLAAQMGLSEHVRFTGELAHADVPRYFRLAELAVLYMSPRLVNEYRCSLKLREYFAAGLKVVGNDFGELGEYAGFLYQAAGGVEAFGRMIVRVLEGFDDRRQDRARRFAMDQLDWTTVIGTGAAEVMRRCGLPAAAHGSS